MEYKKGKENQTADALSGVNNGEQLHVISAAIPVWVTEILNSYEQDNYCKELIMKLSLSPQAELNYTLKGGILRYTELRQQIIKSFHTLALGGHSRERASYQRLKLIFHWVGMKQEVIKYVKQCPVCQKNKSEHIPYPGLLQPLPVPEQAWTHISMDFIEGLPKSEGKDVIMVIVGRFTKYSHFFAMSLPFIVQ